MKTLIVRKKGTKVIIKVIKKPNGFTLVETLVALTIMATLTTIGICIQQEQVHFLKEKTEEVAQKANTHNANTQDTYTYLFGEK